MKIDRRKFLKKAGLGSIALASLPALGNALAKPAWAKEGTNFHFLAFSATGPAGTPASPQHRIAMGGQGTFDPATPGSEVVGGGAYAHHLFPGANPPAGGTAVPIVASGTWKARRLVSYKQIGTWGVLAAGVLEMVIDLFSEIPSKATIRGARLKIACNIGPAGLVNPGEMEGFTLSVPGTDFFTGGTPGPFVPIFFSGAPVPVLGITLFSTVPIPS